MDNADRPVVRHWLLPPQRVPWQWDRTGAALETETRLTIAMREEIAALVQALAPGGLPPLGALALLLAACRESWPTAAPGVFELIGETLEEPAKRQPGLLDQVARVRSRLDAIHALPPDSRATTSAKLALALVLRDRGGPDLPPTAAAEVAAVLATGFPPGWLRRPATGSYAAQLMNVMTYLFNGLEVPAAEVVRLVERTGLETVPQPAPSGPDAVRALLLRAASDEELSGLVALAQRLLAAVHLPRPLADHQDLPVGGVSDLSNRGSLDRLLVGELANDDLVLAVRIATGEALYLRREAPPRQPLATRSLLIDAGIRMWGLPRVFATAIALALAASAPRGTRIRAWRPHAAALEAVDLGTHDGLVRHLAALEPHPQPGASLAAWSAALLDEGEGDAVIITHAAAFDDPAFNAALTSVRLPSIYCATVDSLGQYRLFAITALGRRLVQEATLDLQLLLRPVAGHRTTLLRAERDEPLIYRVAPFPLLLPHRLQARRAVVVPDHGVLAAAHDGRLMLWENGRGVARQLTDQVPIGGVVWMGAHDGTAYLVINQRRERTWVLVSIGLDGGPLQSVPLPLDDEQPRHIAQQGNGLLVVWKRQAAVHLLSDGRRAARMTFPAGVELRETRFLVSPAGWHALAWNGTDLALVEVCKAGATDPRGHYSFAFFDQIGRSGPWGFTTEGCFINMSDGNEVALDLPPGRYRFLEASQDGERVMIAAENHTRFLIDLTERRATPLPRQGPAPEPSRRASPTTATPREGHDRLLPAAIRKASGFSVHLIGPLRGIFRIGSCLAVSTHHRHTWMLDGGLTWRKRSSSDGDPVNLVAFTPLTSVNDRRQLGIARAGMSEFLVDARGLLHCRRPRDRQCPELTLVLHQGPTALWSTDGFRFGPTGFFADGRSWHQDHGDALTNLMSYAGDLP